MTFDDEPYGIERIHTRSHQNLIANTLAVDTPYGSLHPIISHKSSRATNACDGRQFSRIHFQRNILYSHSTRTTARHNYLIERMNETQKNREKKLKILLHRRRHRLPHANAHTHSQFRWFFRTKINDASGLIVMSSSLRSHLAVLCVGSAWIVFFSHKIFR